MKKNNDSHMEIDLGCGPNKKKGAIGVDHYPYSGVDIVMDLDDLPWPFRDNHFSRVYAFHLIEHVFFIPDFMSEVHRICSSGAVLSVITPHFSSLDSWKDPTHRWHLSTDWYSLFCNPNNYLAQQMPIFEAVSSNVFFSRSLRNIWPKLIKKFFGLKVWEKHYSFRYPAKNIHTQLKIIK